MKKLKIFFYIAFLAVLLSGMSLCNVFAAGTDISVAALDMKLTVPENFVTVTRETLPSDEIFSNSELSYDALMASFESDDVFLMCEPQDKSFRITISETENEESRSYHDFNLLTDEQINSIKQSFTAQKDCTSCTTYTEHPQALFFCPISNYTDTSGSPISVAQYITIINGKRLTVQLLTYKDSFTDEQADALNGIVQSIRLGTIIDKPSETPLFKIVIAAVIIILIVLGLLAVVYYFAVLRKRKKDSSLDDDSDFEEFLSNTSIATWGTDISEEPDEPLVIVRTNTAAKPENELPQKHADADSDQTRDLQINREPTPSRDKEELDTSPISPKSDDIRTGGITKPEHNRKDIFSDEIDPTSTYSRPKKAAVKTSGFFAKFGKTAVHILIGMLFLFSLLVSIIIMPFTKNKKKQRKQRRRQSNSRPNRGSASAASRIKQSNKRQRYR